MVGNGFDKSWWREGGDYGAADRRVTKTTYFQPDSVTALTVSTFW